MTEMVFAGTSIEPKWVQPDLKKLTAIVNWKIPENAMALAGFCYKILRSMFVIMGLFLLSIYCCYCCFLFVISYR